MKLGIIGLGRMGNSIAYRVLRGEIEVIGFDIDSEAIKFAQSVGVKVVSTISEVAKKTRVIWLMIPAGELVDETIKKILPDLQKGDIIIDGGNSNFRDSIRRSKKLKTEGVFFLDCGTSGGLHARDLGFSLMVGGDEGAYTKIIPLLKVIAAKNGFAFMGPSGAGHYVKMVHNGIEYGLLQAYAEGFHILKEGRYKDLDLEKISTVWNNGSIIRSWILELATGIFKDKIDFAKISGEIEEGGTGRWTVQEAKNQNIPVFVIDQALKMRQSSRQTGGNYATKLVSLLRNRFGGHKIT